MEHRTPIECVCVARVSDDEDVTTWTGRCSNVALVWIGIAVAVLLAGLAVLLWSSSPPWVVILNAVLAVGILAALLIASRLVVVIDADAFVVVWGFTRWPTRDIPWADVSAVAVVDVDPWQWGGWGYRWIPGRKATAAVVRRGPGIQLDLTDGRHFIVTVDDATAGVAAAQAVLAARD